MNDIEAIPEKLRREVDMELSQLEALRPVFDLINQTFYGDPKPTIETSEAGEVGE